MRFYTAIINNEEELLVGFAQGARAYRLSLLARLVPALAFKDMNELVAGWSEEIKAALEHLAANEDVLTGAAVNVAELQLCAPIVHPRQDVICLGINSVSYTHLTLPTIRNV